MAVQPLGTKNRVDIIINVGYGNEMIFRTLYRRRARRLFGPFVPPGNEELLDALGEHVTEWQAFKLLFMPERTLQEMARANQKCLFELRDMIEDSLGQIPQAQTPNKPSGGEVQ